MVCLCVCLRFNDRNFADATAETSLWKKFCARGGITNDPKFTIIIIRNLPHYRTAPWISINTRSRWVHPSHPHTSNLLIWLKPPKPASPCWSTSTTCISRISISVQYVHIYARMPTDNTIRARLLSPLPPGRSTRTDWKSPWKTDFKWFTCKTHFTLTTNTNTHITAVVCMDAYATFARMFGPR